jgi:hypothetical protein
MFSKLIDSLFPTQFTRLSSDSAHWTGDALSNTLKALNPAMPSHIARAREIRKAIDECIADSREAQVLGCAASVRRADTGKLTVYTADLVDDYRAVSRFINA